MSPEEAVLLASAVTAAGGLITFFVSRWDKNSGRREKRDAKVLNAERDAFRRATESDVALIERLEKRVEAAEKRAESAQRIAIRASQRVFQLERVIVEAGMELPPHPASS